MTRRFPAEWESQSGVMLTWPHDQTDWAPYLEQVESIFCLMAIHISRHEKLLIVARDDEHQSHIQSILTNSNIDHSNVSFYLCDSNDTWARDHGAITVEDSQQPLLLDFQFNGWGNKFNAGKDNKINTCLSRQKAFADTPMQTHSFIMEGGSIESDGAGTLMTTRNCLLSPERNPSMSVEDIESLLKQELGVSRILWLDNGGLEGDDTDSHVDTLARFCDPHTIAYQACDNETDSHYAPLQAMKQELEQFTTVNSKPYRLIAFPLPKAIHDEDGDRLPASYVNFLIINNAVLFPVYDDPADEVALQQIRQAFPEREIIPIPSRLFILQHGSVHCLTMQFPDGVLT